jgi:hypothetical protein
MLGGNPTLNYTPLMALEVVEGPSKSKTRRSPCGVAFFVQQYHPGPPACFFSLEWPIELNGSVLNWTAAYVDWPKLRVNARRHGRASCWMITVDAEHVKNYAAIHVGTDRKDPPDAGDDAAPAPRAPGNEPSGPAEPFFFCPSPLSFGGSTVLSLTRGPAENRTTVRVVSQSCGFLSRSGSNFFFGVWPNKLCGSVL